MTPAYPSPGSDFGDYQLIDVIGSGGMSVVFAAVHRRLGRSVALKVLPPHLARSELYRARFESEANLLTQLNSPHVVSVHDHGEVDGLLYLAMQRIDGEDLGQILADRGPLPPAEALRLAMQLADGLADAHRAGVLHRDVKPSNVLVGSTGDEPFGYLCDFGIAKLEDADAGLTHTGLVAGTWAYLAPERARQQPASRASDLYSLGCVLWAMLTGSAPFRGSDADLLLAHQQQPVPQLADTGRLADVVNRVLSRTLAKEPAERYATAGELKAELRIAAQIAAEPTLEELVPLRPPGPTSERAAGSGTSNGAASGSLGAPTPTQTPTDAAPAGSDPAEVFWPGSESAEPAAADAPGGPPQQSGQPAPRRRRLAPLLVALGVLAAVVVGVLVGREFVGGDGSGSDDDGSAATATAGSSATPSASASPQGDPLGVGVERVDQGCSGAFIVALSGTVTGDPATTVRTALDRFPEAPDPHYLSTADSCPNLSRIRNVQRLPDLPYLGPFPDAASACRARISHTDISTYVMQLDSESRSGFLCACAYAAADLPDLDQTRDADPEGPRRFWTRGLQTMLDSVGHRPQPIDPGRFDQATADAVSDFQTEIEVPATGGLDAATWAALQDRLCDDA